MYQSINMNRRCTKDGRHLCNRTENKSKQPMQQPIKRIASDPRLQLVTGASAANNPNTIGRDVAYFMHLLADVFTRTSFAVLMSQKLVFATFLNAATGSHHALVSVGVGFVGIQLGFLQLLRAQT